VQQAAAAETAGQYLSGWKSAISATEEVRSRQLKKFEAVGAEWTAKYDAPTPKPRGSLRPFTPEEGRRGSMQTGLSLTCAAPKPESLQFALFDVNKGVLEPWTLAQLEALRPSQKSVFPRGTWRPFTPEEAAWIDANPPWKTYGPITPALVRPSAGGAPLPAARPVAGPSNGGNDQIA
jgi:hypothetical protein